jgi:hypothetical protein
VITADQLLAHAVGDYVIQSDWMANEKTKRAWPATVHALTYSLVFVIAFQPDWRAWAVIYATHYVIDRYRLARFVVYAKNVFFSPPGSVPPWFDCAGTGYSSLRPPWLAVWLLIIADNVLHVAINGAALWRWP